MPDTLQLGLRWNADGVIGVSEHLTARLVVRYLLHLASLGDDVTVLWVRCAHPGMNGCIMRAGDE